MKREEIMNMPAGREMDALIAEKVMGWFWKTEGYSRLGFMDGDRFRYGVMRGGGDTEYTGNLHYYSADIAAAWEVVENLRENGIVLWIGPHSETEWAVQIKPIEQNYHEFIRAETAPLAICRAALLAVMTENIGA